MNSQTLSNTDRTSWQRVAMVWKFYLPYTRKKIIMFTLLAFIVEGMMYYSFKNMPQMQGDPIIMVLSYYVVGLIAFSGLVFAKPRGRELQTLLPALGMEKCIVKIGYVTVVIPFLLSIPSIISWIFGDACIERSIAQQLGIEITPMVLVYSVLMLESMALSCLWAVVASKRKYAMRNGILAAVGFFLTLTVISGFIGGIIGGMKGVTVEQMDGFFNIIYTALSVICGIYIIFALIKCCHIIKHGI